MRDEGRQPHNIHLALSSLAWPRNYSLIFCATWRTRN